MPLRSSALRYHDFAVNATGNAKHGSGRASKLRNVLQFGESTEQQGSLVEVEKGRLGPLTADLLPQGCPGGQPRRWDQTQRKRTFSFRHPGAS